MMKGLKLKVLWMTSELEEEIEKEKVLGNRGLPYSRSDLREITFYSIDSIMPTYDPLDNDREYSVINISCKEYITPYTYEELSEIIEGHRRILCFS